MLETALVAFTTFFTTIDPPGVAAVFAALMQAASPEARRATALKAVLVAGGILLFFAFFGNGLLAYLGISLSAMRTAGGILLFIIAVEMVFARTSGIYLTTEDETHEAMLRPDVSVFPLATPLIAGPGAMGAAVLLTGEVSSDLPRMAIVIGMLIANLLVTLLFLRVAGQLQKILGLTGVNVLTRVMGILLAALAVQFVFDGIARSGLLR